MNSVRVDDWTAKSAIIAGNKCQYTEHIFQLLLPTNVKVTVCDIT